jgi:hypothetical protein
MQIEAPKKGYSIKQICSSYEVDPTHINNRANQCPAHCAELKIVIREPNEIVFEMAPLRPPAIVDEFCYKNHKEGHTDQSWVDLRQQTL